MHSHKSSVLKKKSKETFAVGEALIYQYSTNKKTKTLLCCTNKSQLTVSNGDCVPKAYYRATALMSEARDKSCEKHLGWSVKQVEGKFGVHIKCCCPGIVAAGHRCYESKQNIKISLLDLLMECVVWERDRKQIVPVPQAADPCRENILGSCSHMLGSPFGQLSKLHASGRVPFCRKMQDKQHHRQT